MENPQIETSCNRIKRRISHSKIDLFGLVRRYHASLNAHKQPAYDELVLVTLKFATFAIKANAFLPYYSILKLANRTMSMGYPVGYLGAYTCDDIFPGRVEPPVEHH